MKTEIKDYLISKLRDNSRSIQGGYRIENCVENGRNILAERYDGQRFLVVAHDNKNYRPGHRAFRELVESASLQNIATIPVFDGEVFFRKSEEMKFREHPSAERINFWGLELMALELFGEVVYFQKDHLDVVKYGNATAVYNNAVKIKPGERLLGQDGEELRRIPNFVMRRNYSLREEKEVLSHNRMFDFELRTKKVGRLLLAEFFPADRIQEEAIIKIPKKTFVEPYRAIQLRDLEIDRNSLTYDELIAISSLD